MNDQCQCRQQRKAQGKCRSYRRWRSKSFRSTEPAATRKPRPRNTRNAPAWVADQDVRGSQGRSKRRATPGSSTGAETHRSQPIAPATMRIATALPRSCPAMIAKEHDRKNQQQDEKRKADQITHLPPAPAKGQQGIAGIGAQQAGAARPHRTWSRESGSESTGDEHGWLLCRSCGRNRVMIRNCRRRGNHGDAEQRLPFRFDLSVGVAHKCAGRWDFADPTSGVQRPLCRSMQLGGDLPRGIDRIAGAGDRAADDQIAGARRASLRPAS